MSKKDKRSTYKKQEEWYDTGYVSADILKRGDYTKKAKYAGIELEQQYAKLHIRQFANQDEFTKAMKNLRNLKLDDVTINNFWNQYTQRDFLIKTGQYEKLQTNVFQDNYIKGIKVMLGDSISEKWQKIMDTIHSLSPEQWKKLYAMPNADVNSLNKTILPQIRFMYTIAGIKDDKDKYENETMEEILRALKEIGVNVDFDEPSKNLKRLKARAKKANIKWTILFDKESVISRIPTDDPYRKTMRTLLSRSGTAFKMNAQLTDPNISTYSAKARAMELLDARSRDLARKGKTLIKTSKTGKQYIPFVSKVVSDKYIEHIRTQRKR